MHPQIPAGVAVAVKIGIEREPRPPASRDLSRDLVPQDLRLTQTQADRWSSSALRSIGCATTGAEYRHQDFVRLAAHSAVGLYRSDGSGRLSGVALWSGVAFWSGIALWSE